MRWALVLGILAVVAVHAADIAFDGNGVSGLQPVKESEAARAKQIRTIATEFWFQRYGLDAMEGLRVAGSFTVARPIKDFAVRGDKIWEVRVTYLPFTLTGVLWVSDKSEKILALGPEK